MRHCTELHGRDELLDDRLGHRVRVAQCVTEVGQRTRAGVTLAGGHDGVGTVREVVEAPPSCVPMIVDADEQPGHYIARMRGQIIVQDVHCLPMDADVRLLAIGDDEHASQAFSLR